jgi:hypothetical protein
MNRLYVFALFTLMVGRLLVELVQCSLMGTPNEYIYIYIYISVMISKYCVLMLVLMLMLMLKLTMAGVPACKMP